MGSAAGGAGLGGGCKEYGRLTVILSTVAASLREAAAKSKDTYDRQWRASSCSSKTQSHGSFRLQGSFDVVCAFASESTHSAQDDTGYFKRSRNSATSASIPVCSAGSASGANKDE
jgi:hypothetical protein